MQTHLYYYNIGGAGYRIHTVPSSDMRGVGEAKSIFSMSDAKLAKQAIRKMFYHASRF